MKEEVPMVGREKRATRNKRPLRFEEYVMTLSKDASVESTPAAEKKCRKSVVEKVVKSKTINTKVTYL